MKKSCNYIYVLIIRSVVISLGILLPILLYIALSFSTVVDGLEAFLMAVGMVVVNTPFALLLSTQLAKAIGANDYRYFKERVLYGTVLPTYLLLVVCVVILELLANVETDEALFWLVITWGYLFGVIAFVLRRFMLSLKKEEMKK